MSYYWLGGFPMPDSLSSIFPGLRYCNASAAIDWLCRIFGFERHVVYEGENGTILHAELTLGKAQVALCAQQTFLCG